MLGYVIIDKDELKVKEYDVYEGYYCGICKSIGKREGQLPRLILSYDAVFLAIVLASLDEKKDVLSKEHCIVHPLDRRNVVRENAAIDYAADMMVILAYHKFSDDWNDDRSFAGISGKELLKPVYRRLKKKYGKICEGVEKSLKELSALEKEHSGSMDSVTSAFADIMEILFTGFYQDEKLNRILGSFGRGLGKWIYAIDALDDYEEDLKDDQYNPLRYRKMGTDGMDLLLYNYLAETAAAYDLLDIEKNQGIIENVLFRGLRLKTDSVVMERNRQKNEKSI